MLDIAAADFKADLGRHGWSDSSPEVVDGDAHRLRYSMQKYSWTVEISFGQSQTSGITEFHVRGEKE
jgi:hypothetical protein